MIIQIKDKDGNLHNLMKGGSACKKLDLASEEAMSGKAIAEWLPFKLGIDEDGNYGYIKNGETEVTPF